MTPLRSILSWLRIEEIWVLSLTKGGKADGEIDEVVGEELVDGAFAVGRTVSERRIVGAAAAAAAGAVGAGREAMAGCCWTRLFVAISAFCFASIIDGQVDEFAA